MIPCIRGLVLYMVLRNGWKIYRRVKEGMILSKK